MRRVAIMIGCVAWLPACEQVTRVDDEGGGACVPVEVQAAFDRSCAGGTCHVGGMGGGLTLDAGQSASIIGRTASTGTLPLVELGNTAGSYLAQKLVANPTVTIVGARMPDPFDPNNENVVADVNTILTWIAGGVFECAAEGTDGTSAGTEDPTSADTGTAPIQQCGTQDLKPGAVSPIVTGTEPMQIPPDIGTILDENCGCHYADELTVPGATDYPSALPFKMDTLAGFLAERQAGEPYHQVALARVAADVSPMPTEPFCNVGEGEGMPVDQRATLVQWLTEGAPDCTTWSGCAGGTLQACGIEDIKPGSPNPIMAGDAAGQIPTTIGTILAGNCGCHYVDDPTADVVDYQGSADLTTVASFQAPLNGGDPLHAIARGHVESEFMPLESSCDIGGGEAMPAADRTLLVKWLTEGAPDGATFMP